MTRERSTRVEASPDPRIDALRRSHDALRATVEPLGEDRLRQPSYASEWSIAQVLSHLGSGAEIFMMFLDAGLSGAEPPGQDAFPPIWQAWNERSPQAQAADALAADGALVARLESLDPDERASMRLQMFGMDLDVSALAGMRLGEHAVHSWDVAVALDPSATIAADAVNLLVDRVGQLAARSGKPGGRQLSARVTTTAPERSFDLQVGEGVTLEAADPAASGDHADGGAALRLPAEALIRLVYGRLDPAHTPPVEATEVDLDDLRQIFPGF
jgi:uncharacterized protein (TIGR03083 family)